MSYTHIRFLLVALVVLATTSLACTGPGDQAVTYSDGSFDVPSGNTPSFTIGSQMNITWTTKYRSSTLWLIAGCNFAAPYASLVTGTTDNHFVWDITTTSTNSSEIYLFRVVDSFGNTTSQTVGGFASASFFVAGGPKAVSSSAVSSSSTVTSISSTSSSLSPSSTAAISMTPVASSSATPTAAIPVAPSTELSEGTKAGIGVGLGVGALIALAIGAGIFFTRKRPSTQAHMPTYMEPPRYREVREAQVFQPTTCAQQPTLYKPTWELSSERKTQLYEM